MKMLTIDQLKLEKKYPRASLFIIATELRHEHYNLKSIQCGVGLNRVQGDRLMQLESSPNCVLDDPDYLELVTDVFGMKIQFDSAKNKGR